MASFWRWQTRRWSEILVFFVSNVLALVCRCHYFYSNILLRNAYKSITITSWSATSNWFWISVENEGSGGRTSHTWFFCGRYIWIPPLYCRLCGSGENSQDSHGENTGKCVREDKTCAWRECVGEGRCTHDSRYQRSWSLQCLQEGIWWKCEGLRPMLVDGSPCRIPAKK